MTNDKSPSGRWGSLRKSIEVLRAISDLSQLSAPVKWLVGGGPLSLGIAAVAFLLHHEHGILRVVIWGLAILCALPGAVLVVTSGVLPGGAKAAWQKVRPLVATLITFVLTASLVAELPWIARSLDHRIFPGPCAPPVDLRVLTAPENVPALQWAAAGFTASEKSRCVPVRIAVAPSGSLNSVLTGFRKGWYPASGAGENNAGALQPDIIIPGSSAELAQLLSDHSQDVKLTNEGSIGTSPLAVGISSTAANNLNQALAPKPQFDLPELLTTAQAFGVRSILRASPDMSEIGALATIELYQTHALGDTPKQTEQALAGSAFPEKAAQALAGSAIPLGNSASLLCGLRTHVPPNPVAVIAPEQVLTAYAPGRPVGDCSAQGAADALTIYYPSKSHVLDYPFVRVTWTGQESSRRNAQIKRFRRWLGSHPLQAQGFRDTEGGIKASYPGQPATVGNRPFASNDITGALQDIAGTWPPLRVVLAVDVSGSMSGGRSEGGSRFTYAVELARSAALNMLHDEDTAELDVFSHVSPTPGKPGKRPFRQLAAPSNQPNRPGIAPTLDGLALEGSDIPLFDAIDQAAQSIAGYKYSAAVIFTDGGSQGGDLASKAQALRDRLSKAPPPILVLTGTQTCAQSAPIKALGTAVKCVDSAGHETNDTVASIFNAARWGS